MSTCWTEKQKKWKQHARDTAERRRRWEKIAAEQEEEEELKLKKALQQRKRELESKNRYLRQPQAKPPPPKRSFLIKGSKRPVDRHDEALTNQSRLKGVGTKPERREAGGFIHRQDPCCWVRLSKQARTWGSLTMDTMITIGHRVA